MTRKAEPARIGSSGGLQENVDGTLQMTQNCSKCQAETRECRLRSAVKQLLVHGYCKGQVPFAVVVQQFRRHDLGGC